MLEKAIRNFNNDAVTLKHGGDGEGFSQLNVGYTQLYHDSNVLAERFDEMYEGLLHTMRLRGAETRSEQTKDQRQVHEKANTS